MVAEVRLRRTWLIPSVPVAGAVVVIPGASSLSHENAVPAVREVGV